MGVTVGVLVTVAVAVIVGVGVALGVGVAVLVGAAVGVRVGVAVKATQPDASQAAPGTAVQSPQLPLISACTQNVPQLQHGGSGVAVLVGVTVAVDVGVGVKVAQATLSTQAAPGTAAQSPHPCPVSGAQKAPQLQHAGPDAVGVGVSSPPMIARVGVNVLVATGGGFESEPQPATKIRPPIRPTTVPTILVDLLTCPPIHLLLCTALVVVARNPISNAPLLPLPLSLGTLPLCVALMA